MNLSSAFFALTIVGALAALPATADAAPLTCDGKRVTIAGTTGDDTIRGTARADVIHARGGNDTVRGRAGNDTICGGDGRDRLLGGPGNDRVHGGRDQVWDDPGHGATKTGDTLSGGTGDDLLDPGVDTRPVEEVDQPDSISWADSGRGVSLDIPDRRATGQGVDRIARGFVQWVLTSHPDHVTGGDGRDWLVTGAGSDVVRAGRGDDRVDVDDGPGIGSGGADVVRGGPGDDFIATAAGSDRVRAGSGNDAVVDGAATVDQFYLEGGNDLLIDVLVARAGQVVSGGAGIDKWSRSSGPELSGTWDMASGALVLGGSTHVTAPGWEEAYLGLGGWTVQGTAGNDVIGTGSATTFHGLGGDDTFSGSIFDDLFDGGPGDDTAPTMAEGDDTCISVESIVDGTCEHVSP